jgi:hypothetical protein
MAARKLKPFLRAFLTDYEEISKNGWNPFPNVMKPLITTLLFSLSFAGPLLAQGKIEGAFGQKLGTVFDPSGAAPLNVIERNDVLRYRFTPVAAFEGLTDYLVEVCPTTHRICSINATGQMAEPEAARRITVLLDIVLHEKYADDPPPKQGGTSTTSQIMYARDVTKIEQHQQRRYIKSYYTAPPAAGAVSNFAAVRGQAQPASVSLSYWDTAMFAEARKEAEAIKKEKEAILQAEKAVRDKAAKEAEEKRQAEEAKQRAEERVRLKEEVTRMDTSGV